MTVVNPSKAKYPAHPAASFQPRGSRNRREAIFGNAENHATFIFQIPIFHYVTIPVLCSWFGGTPAPTAGTGPLHDGNLNAPWDYGRNSHFDLGFSRLYQALVLAITEAPQGMIWDRTR
jgi:hypothetical protein